MSRFLLVVAALLGKNRAITPRRLSKCYTVPSGRGKNVELKLHDSFLFKILLLLMISLFIYTGIYFWQASFGIFIRLVFSSLSLGLCCLFSWIIVKGILLSYSFNSNKIVTFFNDKIIKEMNISDIIGLYFESESSKLNIFSKNDKLTIPYSGYKLKKEIKLFVNRYSEMIETKSYDQISKDGIIAKNKNNQPLYKIEANGIYIYKKCKLILWSEITKLKVIRMNGLLFYQIKASEKIAFSDFHINGSLGFLRYLQNKIKKNV